MIRHYRHGPFRTLFLHGGPGAPGGPAEACREIGQYTGILEPWQSRYTVADLVEELDAQIHARAEAPVTLIGHSWGAWLSLLYAAQCPQQVRALIWVGCPPLEEHYAAQINKRRMANLSPRQAAAFRQALDTLQHPHTPAHSAALHTLDMLAQKADNVCPLPADCDVPPPNEQMFSALWPQAAALRAKGTLLKAAQLLRCPITIIHGAQDPHPSQGVTAPLARLQIPFTKNILPRCGHTPWIEKHARTDFFRLLRAALNG